MNRNKAKVALDSLKKINEYKQCNNYGRAFAHYLVFLELSPLERSNYEKDFSGVLSTWCVELEDRNQFEDLYKCYLQGLHYYPLSIEILNNFGAHLLRLEQEHQAKKYLKLAHNLDKDFLPVEKNLSSAKTSLVPRWHFRMLNNLRRNEPYLKAITSVIDANYNRVLDIGTGCGLLSIFASRNPHIEHIYAIEESKAMSEIAKEVFQNNNISKVTLFAENSTQLTPYRISRSNVLITEIFDTAVFGEHVLESLIHAHKNLMENEFKIIPSSANVYITGIECTAINKKQRFMNYDLNYLKLNNICIRSDFSEPYEAEHILDYDHKLVTNTCKFITVDFGNLQQLESIYRDENFIPLVDLECVEAGTLQAFVIWFDLQLKDEIITTNPFDPKHCNCWEQAIVYLDHPLVQKKGDCVKLQVSCVEDKLEVHVINNIVNCHCFEVSQDAVMFLNNKELIEDIEKISEKFNGENMVVLDLYPIPIFGLIMALKNAHIFTTAIEPELLTCICEQNGINMDNITVIEEEELFKYLECNNIFDIIFYNPVTKNGTINEKFYSNYNLFLASLKENGLFLPQSVKLNVQMVESDYLHYSNKVDDVNLYNYKIADYINEYMIYEQWNLEQSFNPNVLTNILSEYTVAFDDGDPITKQFKVRVSSSGGLNGILYWYSINLYDDIVYNTLKSNYYNRACFILKDEIAAVEKDILNIHIKQHKGLIKITCKKAK